jgi:uncharacterized membrane protein YkoI
MPAYNEAILAGNLIPEHSVDFTNFRPHDYSGGLVRLWPGIATLSTPINGGRKSETTMKTKVIRLALSLALVAGLGLSVAVAATESHGAIKAQAKITREEATKTALTKVPNGRIKTAELEKEHGRLIWSFDISMPKSTKITEIQVDANTGKIVSTQVETLADQAKEAAADKKAKK